MDEQVKLALLEMGEESTKVVLEHAIKVAKAYAASSSSVVDDTVVAGVETLYNAFIKDLADKINPND